MNIKFQRMIDRFVGIPVCAMLSFFDFFRRKSNTLVKPQKILVILLSEMGSLVLAQPMFVRLKQKYPNASIHVLLFGKNREILDLMKVIPEENVITINDSSLGKFVFGSIKTIKQLRSYQFDWVIDCELFSRVSSIFAYLSGAKLRVGFHRHTQEGLYRGSFINRPVMYNPYRHLTHQFLTMVEAANSETVPTTKHFPTPTFEHPPLVKFTEEKLQLLFAKLHSDFPAIKNKRLMLIYPSGGILPIRAWSFENYCQLTKTFLNDDFAVGVIGLKSDKALGQSIVAYAQNPNCIDLTGYTKSVTELLMLFHRASLLVTNDGGPGQFAALTPVPTIVFFGPETPLLYKALGTNTHALYLQLPCSPCLTAYNHRTSPCDGNNECLKLITPAQVIKKARELLAHSVDQTELISEMT
jgi:ADP-heptose:LPS heptosyltransferase